MSEENIIKRREIKNVKNIIIVASGKGGVGKSTVAGALAVSLSLEGYSTGLLDADIYGPSIPTLFKIWDNEPDVTEINGVQYVEPFVRMGVKLMSIGFFVDPVKAAIWRGPLAANGMKQMIDQTNWGELDYLIIDTPPGTGDIHISLLQEYKISGVVVVTTPQILSTGDVQKAISLYTDPNVYVPVLGIVENMSWFTPATHPDEKYLLFGKGGGEYLAKKFGLELITKIPLFEGVSEYCDEGKIQDVLRYEEVKQAYDVLCKKVVEETTSGKKRFRFAPGK